jgi:hypothetical protein
VEKKMNTNLTEREKKKKATHSSTNSTATAKSAASHSIKKRPSRTVKLKRSRGEASQ